MIERLWRFLGAKKNREVLGWIGGGLVVLASAIWVVTIYFFPARHTPESNPAAVEARCGSVAVGGSVKGAIITAGSTGADCSTKPK
jgi:hypothetical protein